MRDLIRAWVLRSQPIRAEMQGRGEGRGGEGMGGKGPPGLFHAILISSHIIHSTASHFPRSFSS